AGAVLAQLDHLAAGQDVVAGAQARLGVRGAGQVQALGRGRVAVLGQGLDEDAAQALGEIAGDHALDGHLPAFQRAARAAALDLGDGDGAGHLRRGGGGRRRRGLAGGQGQEQQEDGGAQAHGGSGSFRGAETTTPPEGGVAARAWRPAYLRLSSIHWTVAMTCSSVRAGLPPLAGITPALPWKPSMACLFRVSMPWAMRAAQAARSNLGAPPAPESWQAEHRAL